MRPEDRKRNNMTMRLRDTTRAALERAAAESGRSTSEEIEYRLELSLAAERDPLVTPAQRHLARQFLFRFAQDYPFGGEGGVVALMITLGDPDADERERRCSVMAEMIEAYRRGQREPTFRKPEPDET